MGILEKKEPVLIEPQNEFDKGEIKKVLASVPYDVH